LQGAAPTAASDLYAVGLIAYEIFTGEHLYNLDDVQILMEDTFNKSMDADDVDVAMDVYEVLERLLKKAPEDRYRHTTDVLDELASKKIITLTAADRPHWDSYLRAARFVGREKELSQLDTALDEALSGKGSAWLIGGESGVGKSRLAREIQVRAMVRGALPLVGQAVIGGGLPYQLWRDPVRRLALVTEIGSLDAGILKSIAPDLPRLLEYEVADPPPVDEENTQRRLVASLVALLRTYNQPIVLVLEDLQWSMESLDVLDHISQALLDLPVLVLATYRTDEAPDMPDKLAHMESLPLARLDEDEIADLSESMLGVAGRAPQVVDLLTQETEGNIFFLIETVRTLVEEAGTLGNIGRMTLPPRVFAGGVQQVVERRLNRLPDEHYPLLQLAAIANRQIDPVVMQNLVSENTDFDAWLVACLNSAVFTVKDGVYAFAHDKLREGVLDTMDTAQMSVGSELVAKAIEKAYPDDNSQAGMLAWHWRNAENTEREAHYTFQAVQQIRQHDTKTTHTYLHRLLQLLEDDDSRLPAVHWMLGELFLHMSNYDQAEMHFKRGYDIAHALSTPAYTARNLEGLGTLAIRQSQLADAKKYYEGALESAKKANDNALIALQLNAIGAVYAEQGNYDTAQQFTEDGMALSKADDDRISMARGYNTLGILAYRRGDLQGAWDYFEQCLTIRRELGLQHAVAASLNNIGVIASSLGKFQEAIRYHDDSRKIKTDIGDHFGVGNSLQNIGIAYMNLGVHEAAKRYFEQALVIAQAMNHRVGEADIHNALGLIIRRLGGDLGIAREHLEKAIALATEIDDKLGIALAQSNLGDVLIGLDDIDSARETLQDALDTARAINATQPLLRTLMWFGKLQSLAGNDTVAATLWSYVNLHDSCDIETRNDSERLLSEMSETVSAEVLANAIRDSEKQTLDSIIALSQ
ncbi:MAG: tetratricopeptide repeat protein, partial [Chloroflexota bacterium]